MPKRIRKNRELDVNQLVHHSIQRMADAAETPMPVAVEDDQPVFLSPTQADISRIMAEMGRRGGKLGGKRRAANMTEAQRSNAAAAAANARWTRIRAQAES
jgi:hypothetical protein